MIDYNALKSHLEDMGGVVIGYSGGVDSTLLAKVATDALGEGAISVLVESCLCPEAELKEAVDNAEALGLNLIRVRADALAVEGVPENKADRCYHCKNAVFSHMLRIADERGLPCVVDGANADDARDFRPGSAATKEMGVRSPFKELGMTKEQIRSISREIGLPTWNKPSYACLASRVPYGTRITREVLKQIEDSEDVLRQMGFSQFRVRHHGEVARIELMPIEMEKMLSPVVRAHIVEKLRWLGYKYVALDLSGYKTGSLNAMLSQEV